MEWQIFMTFAFTRRDVVIVPWRSDGGGGVGGGGLGNLAHMAFELWLC